jgi:glycosyltransferase involved in cell wall biosynthesis
MRILLISRMLPFPPDNGSKVRAAYTALHLAQRYEVVLGCFAVDEECSPRWVEYSDRFWDFKVVPCPAPGPRLRAWFSSEPSDVQRYQIADMVHYIDKMIAQFSPEVVIVDDPALTPYVVSLPDRVRILAYDSVKTLWFERSQALETGPWRALWVFRRLKAALHHRRIAGYYDLCIVTSEQDRAALLATSPAWKRVEIVPNGLNLADYPMGLAPLQPDTLVFPGALTYPPNLDAARYLVHDILPCIRAEAPNVRLFITGQIPTDGSAPEGPGVVYTGYVPDVRPIVAGSWACVVPLRAGAGTRIKILEALALGTPVVSTALGAEGLAVTAGVDILMAEDAAGFAAQTVKLLRSPKLRERLTTAGRRLIEQQHDWERLGERFTALVSEFASKKEK